MLVQPGAQERERAERVSAEWRNRLDLLVVRFFGSHAQIGTYWQTFGELLAEAGIDASGRRCYGMSLDNPEITPRGLMRYDCAIEVPASLTAGLKAAPFHPMTLPRTRVASIVHDGPYLSVFASYRAIIDVWVPEKRHQYGDGPALEVYEELPWRDGLEQHSTFAIEMPIL
jgi:AraC family transcriptional regulator